MRLLALTPAPLPKWERGDSGARVWHPIAVHSYYEHLFGPPLKCAGRGPSSLVTHHIRSRARQRCRGNREGDGYRRVGMGEAGIHTGLP
jgi:hypothetical protein